ncbi:MAG: Hsp33 family molecular chaperone HslO, partial [Acholeplasmatales bacterium]|nr:Hsp33 family molecular chaperone HslO [Acholeplasmatales bacterium]
MKDYLQKAYCMNQTVRIYAAITTDIVKEAKELFNLWPSSLQALGRTLTIAAIMSCTYKSGEFLNIKLDCDGPV